MIFKMAAQLEQFVNNVRNYSQQGNFAQLCEYISKTAEILSKHASHLDNVLATLDLQQHSLGVLAILIAKYWQHPNIGDFEGLFALTQEFIHSSNGEQVRYATDSYADLCHLLTFQLVERKQPNRGILLLSKAIWKIQLYPSQLTSIHADLCQLCLLAKNLKPALEFLEIDITDLSKENGQYDVKYFLAYYYYGGMVYTGLKNYDRALYFYEIAVTTPAMAVSHIMLEAYKKYILVSLIKHGKIIALPKYSALVVTRFIKPLSQAYHDLATAYVTSNPDEVRNCVTKHGETFTGDNNMGLVMQCITSLYKKNIQRLTKTFLTLSLNDMANRVQLSSSKEAEKYVLHMIEDGEIFATINQRDGMVSFHDNPEKYNSAETLQQLDAELRKCVQLDEKLRSMDQEITVNAQYIRKSSGMQEDDLSSSAVSMSTNKVGGHYGPQA